MASGTRRAPARRAAVADRGTAEAPRPAPNPAGLAAELAGLGAPRRPVYAADVELMLAQTAERPFSGKGWLFELKHDGFRMLAARARGECRLYYRRGGDARHSFPDVVEALRTVRAEDFVLDGELVILDPQGRSSFQSLQKRFQLLRRPDIGQAARRLPATLFGFDLLALAGHDLRGLPLRERKRLLRLVLPPDSPVRYADHVEEHGEAFYEEVRKRDLEGIVAKRADSPYRAGRWADWLKVRVDRTADFVVVGFTEPRGGRAGFGALHLAWYDEGELTYAGRAGSGFDEAELAGVRSVLEAARRPSCPCRGPAQPGRGHHWVEPRLVAEVRYKEWTDEGLLRQPVFLRFRTDKRPKDCVRDRSVAAGTRSAAPPDPPTERSDPSRRVVRASAEGAGSRIKFTNLGKVFWPEDGITKGDLIEFYRAVSPWLLPYLRDRPLVLTRYPDGIAGKSFYQKDAPRFARDRVRTTRVWHGNSTRAIDYFVCEDVDSLAYLANLGTIPLHVWSSRTASIDLPDWCILDLDPKGAPFAHVVRLALAIRRLTEQAGLPAFVKTSGSTGLHVLIPLGAKCTHEQSRSLGELIGWLLTSELPEIATIARPVGERGGRVYVDYLQNAHGQLLVAPFSVRPLPGAPVSTPLQWREVNARLDPARFNLRTVPKRLARMRDEPMSGLLAAEPPELARALERLQRQIERGERHQRR